METIKEQMDLSAQSSNDSQTPSTKHLIFQFNAHLSILLSASAPPQTRASTILQNTQRGIQTYFESRDESRAVKEMGLQLEGMDGSHLGVEG